MKKIGIFVVWLIMLLGMTGCHKTPDSPVVVGKDNDKMIEMANSLENKSLTIAEQINAPESVQLHFSDSSGKLYFQVDANVIIPEADSSQIIQVTSHEITQEEVDLWTDALFTGKTLYTVESFEQMTKSQIREEIEKVQDLLDEYGKGGESQQIIYSETAAESDDSETTASETVSEETTEDILSGILANYQKRLLSAPEEIAYEETTNELTFHEGQTFTWTMFGTPNEAGTGIMAFNANNSEGFHTITYTDRGDSTYTGNGLYLTYKMMEDNYEDVVDSVKEEYNAYMELPIPDITVGNATEVGGQFLKNLNFNGYTLAQADMAVSSSGVTDFFGNPQGNALRGWKLAYTREVNGIPVTYQESFQGANSEHQEWWNYEFVTLFVTDNGVIEAYIAEPYDLGDVLCSNCKLMDFEKVMDIFQKMMPIEHNMTSLGDHALGGEWNVTSIEFGYTRIREENKDFTGLLVPTWTFFGDHEVIYAREDGERRVKMTDTMFLTINAIDGSIIDVGLGY